MFLHRSQVSSDLRGIIPLDEYASLFIHSSVKCCLFIPSLWNKFMNPAALDIHILVVVGNFLGPGSLGRRVDTSLTLWETITTDANYSTHDLYFLFFPPIIPSALHCCKVWENLILASEFLEEASTLLSILCFNCRWYHVPFRVEKERSFPHWKCHQMH